MKATLYLTTLVVIIGSLLIASSVSLSIAQVSTEISGIITSNSTWTRTGGPYTLVGPVIVSNGVTLTIQPGTSVLLGNYYLLINGTLRAQGLASDPIILQNGTSSSDSKGNPIYPITFTSFSTAWNEQLGNGSILENTILRSTSVYISASPKISSSLFQNSFIRISNYTLIAETPLPASPTIFNNTMKSTTAFSGIISFNSIGNITNNNISGYEIGIELHSDTGTNIQNNLVSGNTYGMQLIAQTGPVLATIRNNTITNNTIGIALAKLSTAAANPTIQYNNIYSNTNFNINSSVPDNINAANNWWGTTSTSAINQSIWDFKRDPNIGNVTFVPFLNAANPAAPSPQPSPTTTPSPTPLITPIPTPTPALTPTSTSTPTTAPTPSPSTIPTQTATVTASPTSTITPTNPPSTTPTQTPTIRPSETPQATPIPTSSTNGETTLSVVALYAGIIAVVIIIVAAAILMRKRRKQL